MQSMLKISAAVFLAIIVALSGCVQETDDSETTNDDDNVETPGAEMSFTTVTISDAPSDNFSHINVTFSEVKVHKSGNDNNSGWISFEIEPKTIDMIYLHATNLSEELGGINLTAGNYTKLWIVVDSATGVLKETAENITFDVPSGDLKIQQSFEITQGNTTIDVEIDLERSVLYVPQGGVYKLLPQLGKMTVNNEDKEEPDEEVEPLVADAGDEYEALVNKTIEFEGKAEGGVEPYNWSWDFGDENTSTEQNPEHTYMTAGNYTATLSVTDADGTIATDTATVEINEESED